MTPDDRDTHDTTDAACLLAILVDMLPAWILPAYGCTWVSTPSLDALAAAGVVFDRVLAPSVSPASAREAVLPEAARAEATRVEGVEAAARAVREGRQRVVVCHVTRLASSWIAPVELREQYRDPEDPPALVGSAVPDLGARESADPDAVNVVRQAFAAEATFLDRELRELVETACNSPRPWHVLFAGTSGMPLGLHGQSGLEREPPVCVMPMSERVHLPVILRHASGRMAAQRYPGLLAAADIGATLAAWLGCGPAGGGGVAGLFETWSAEPRALVRIEGVASAAVATADWHLVASWPAGREAGVKASLFHKPDDFFEVNDVADRCADVVERLLPACLE